MVIKTIETKTVDEELLRERLNRFANYPCYVADHIYNLKESQYCEDCSKCYEKTIDCILKECGLKEDVK